MFQKTFFSKSMFQFDVSISQNTILHIFPIGNSKHRNVVKLFRAARKGPNILQNALQDRFLVLILQPVQHIQQAVRPALQQRITPVFRSRIPSHTVTNMFVSFSSHRALFTLPSSSAGPCLL